MAEKPEDLNLPNAVISRLMKEVVRYIHQDNCMQIEEGLLTIYLGPVFKFTVVYHGTPKISSIQQTGIFAICGENFPGILLEKTILPNTPHQTKNIDCTLVKGIRGHRHLGFVFHRGIWP